VIVNRLGQGRFFFDLRRMQFKKVIGQQEVKQHLAEMIHHNRLSHALLFLAKEGSGGLPMAMAFAQFVLCEKNNPRAAAGPSLFCEEPAAAPVSQPADSCGECPSCVKIRQLIHPDVHFSYPVVTKKAGTPPISTDYITEWREFVNQYAYGNIYDWLQFIGAENKQGNITAAECNDIIRKLNLKSYEGDYKILILWMPEYLEKEGNKLLKLIEEPPANTLFILVAENESQILPTILSRCQLIKIPPIGTEAITAALVERANVPAAQARQIASVAEGNYREALQVIQHADEDWQALLREWLNAILKTGPIAQVKWVEEMAKTGREKQKQFLRYFNHLLEMAIRVRVLGKINIGDNAGDAVTEGAEYDFAVRLNKIAGIEQQQAMIEELDKAAYYIERNANGKMLFQALTIKLYHIIADKSLILTN
jgi:DNA polymerase III subunit delta'